MAHTSLPKNLMTALAVAIGLLAPAAVVVTPAQAAPQASSARVVSLGCVTDYMFSHRLLAGDSRTRTHQKFRTYPGFVLDRQRSGYHGRKLDEWRGYTSCDYPDDDVEINFDDYTYGTARRGGALRVYDAFWTHYCIEYEELYDVDGYNYGFECFDPYWQEIVYYDGEVFSARSAHGKMIAPRKAAGTTHDDKVVTRTLK